MKHINLLKGAPDKRNPKKVPWTALLALVGGALWALFELITHSVVLVAGLKYLFS
jgi:hypothetical protein